MSHHNETIICPNCNSEASGNFCSQCGQENHLHKETFWKLIAHFIGHYFHYDNKFWQSLKTLWFSPGTLTLAYWKKQRMRYISPMSLYIFISAVYFLLAFTFSKPNSSHLGTIVKTVVTDSSGAETEVTIDSFNKISSGEIESGSRIERYLKRKTENIATHHRIPVATYLKEKVWHTLPKLMFFMIPVLAWLLKIRFRGRENILFVDHAIFAFHTHCFWFSARVLSLIHIHPVVGTVINVAFFTVFFIYMVSALKKVYEIDSFNAALTLLGITFFYAVILVVVTIITMFTYFMLA